MSHHNGISVIGKMLILEGIILLIPLLILPFYPNEINYSWKFIVPAIVAIIIGIFIHHINGKKISSCRLVVLSWLNGFVFAAIPFWLYGNLTLIQAIFESVSGYTTTGLSVLDVEVLPHIYLFYRGFLQYVGGLGFVMTMLLFIQEKNSVMLYEAEGHPDKIMGSIGKTAKVIAMMYGIFLVVGTVLYRIFGMPLFDGLVHAMCALSTGGFSNKLLSIGYYNSLSIECVTILLMIIGTTNFSLLLLLFRGRIREFIRASEIRFMILLSICSIFIISFFLIKNNISPLQSLRLSIFNAFSALSTTGYATCSYNEWPQTAQAILIILMIVGGGVGSTAGGIKLGRVCRLMKRLLHNIKKKMIPDRAVTLIYYNKGTEKQLLDEEQLEEDSTYGQTYLLIFIFGTIALTYFAKCTLLEGAFEFASSLGTVGLSIGVTNIETSSICLLIEILGMILGRLEIFALLQFFKKG